jgi:hypothetical protein
MNRKFLLFALAVLLMSCHKDMLVEPKTPLVTEKPIIPLSTWAVMEYEVDYPGKISFVVWYSENEDMSNPIRISGEMTPDSDHCFTVNIPNLSESTTYYYYYEVLNPGLYFKSDKGSFETESSNAGAILSLFSVGEDKKVNFSQGNLQYQASTDTWRFAGKQWDFVGSQIPTAGDPGGTVDGSDNSQIYKNYEGWIDLFGWGTSGYDNTTNDPYAENYHPWSSSTNQLVEFQYNFYGYGPSTNMPSTNLTNNSANYDWGVYNEISNGGNQAGLWRTLTQEEWYYVFRTRQTTSRVRFAKAMVNNVCGVILLPDDWIKSNYPLNKINEDIDVEYAVNTITATQWAKLESFGAVFLPAAGERLGTSVDSAGSGGMYWSTSCSDVNDLKNEAAIGVSFDYNVLHANIVLQRCGGRSVRLVRDAQ